MESISSSFCGWDDRCSLCRIFRHTYPAAYRSTFFSSTDRGGRLSLVLVESSSWNRCLIISLNITLVRCWVRMGVTGSPTEDVVKDDHCDRNFAEVRILWKFAHIFSLCRCNRFDLVSKAVSSSAVILAAHVWSTGAFSSFMAHSSRLIADTRALQALEEVTLNPSSSSTFFNAPFNRSAAPYTWKEIYR